MPLPSDSLPRPSMQISRKIKKARAKPSPTIRRKQQPSQKRVKGKRAPMSVERKIKLFKASIASEKTPVHLKVALRKKLKELGA